MAIRALRGRHFLRITLKSFLKIQSLSATPNQIAKVSSQTLQTSESSTQASIASTLQRYGFPQSQTHKFIEKNQLLSVTSSVNIDSCINSLLQFGIPQNDLALLLISCPKVLELEFLNEWKMAFSKFESCSTSVIITIIEHAAKFHIEPNYFSRNVEIMKENFGLSDRTLISVFEVLPTAFMKGPIDVGRRIKILTEFGISKDDIDTICSRYPEFLALGVDGRLKPLLNEFRDLGFTQNEIKMNIVEDPNMVLSMEVGEISKCMQLIKSLKCKVSIKEKILAYGYFKGGIHVKNRIDFLCKYGLIRRDAFKVLYVEPRTIIQKLEDIEKKIDFLVQKMGFTVEHLVLFPDYLGVSLEKHIVPRFNVIEHLKSIGGLCFEVELKHFVRLTRMKFYNLYVKPYPECEEIFNATVREKEVRPRHPPGLWKMFKPPCHPVGEEDVKNIRLFVDSLVKKSC